MNTTSPVLINSKLSDLVCKPGRLFPSLPMILVRTANPPCLLLSDNLRPPGRNHPTTGKLVELNHEEFVLETKGSLGSVIRCHLPRLGYSIKGDPKLQNKL